MPDLPADRHARFVVDALDLAPGDRLTVCTPYAAELVSAFAGGLGRATLHVVTYDLRAAEHATARRDALPPDERARVTVSTGDGPGAAAARPTVILLWPSGWEGHARLRAHVRESMAALPIGGRLYLLVTRNRGATTLLDMMRRNCGGAMLDARGPAGLRLLWAVKRHPPETARAGAEPATPGGQAADEQDVVDAADAADGLLLVEADVAGHHFVFRTAPGVFSHLTLNAGTRFFLEALEARERDVLAGCRTMLDLGCGYGAIGVVLATVHPEARVVLADVDVRATSLAAQNIALNGLSARVEARLSDGLRHLGGETFDAILSHFPLHIPRYAQIRLLEDARSGLREGGRICLSSLAAYDLRPAVRAVFGHVHTVAEGLARTGDRYRVIAAQKGEATPRPVIRLDAGARDAGPFDRGASEAGAFDGGGGGVYTAGTSATRLGRSNLQAPSFPASPADRPVRSRRERGLHPGPSPSSS